MKAISTAASIFLVGLFLVQSVDPPTSQPSSSPTIQNYIPKSPNPTNDPTSSPTGQPSNQPSRQPSRQPSSRPTSQPTGEPTQPSSKPTGTPTKFKRPSRQPSSKPTKTPITPTPKPSTPTSQPSRQPSRQPSGQPSSAPTGPTPHPTLKPTRAPHYNPTRRPTDRPSVAPSSPSIRPTLAESSAPTTKPTARPSLKPTLSPVGLPTIEPSTPPGTSRPSGSPSGLPSNIPTLRPTASPTTSHDPTVEPSCQPSSFPSAQPIAQPSAIPTTQPSSQPTQPSSQPTRTPSSRPSHQPTSKPTRPSSRPSTQPSRQPSGQPSSPPTSQPSSEPSNPSSMPTSSPTSPTSRPSSFPSSLPSSQPSSNPSQPSSQPSGLPSSQPFSSPTIQPSTLASSLGTAYYNRMSLTEQSYAFYDVNPLPICEDLVLTIVLDFVSIVPPGDTIRLYTSGITSGACTRPETGPDISPLLLFNASNYRATFYEGSYGTMFSDSRIDLMVTAPGGIQHDTIVLDRANGLKRVCTKDTQAWTAYAKHCSATGCGSFVKIGDLSLFNGFDNILCAVYKTSLTISSSAPRRTPSLINISISLSFPLDVTHNIIVNLPSFTSRQRFADDTVLLDGPSGYLLSGVTWNTSFPWKVYWGEGIYGNNYLNSSILLTPQNISEYHARANFTTAAQKFADSNFWVAIDRYPNHLTALCSSVHNDSRFSIDFFTSGGANYYATATSFGFVSPVGQACDVWKGCSGHGYCSVCSGSCSCMDGFGSPNDLRFAVSNDFQADCSTRACPLGPSTGIGNRASGFKLAQHQLIECSGSGLCDRSLGECKCFTGYEGAACEKMACPDAGSGVCSGRGECLAMKHLALRADAFPLSSWHVKYRPPTGGLSHNRSWDNDLGHACVCDSSWAVGLGANETQEAEWFGPACELRHCPSGDDPATRYIDETDCHGKATYPGAASEVGAPVGAYGNICHVDCSNRGTCDYKTGLCACYDGFAGANCGIMLNYLSTISVTGS